MLNLKSVRPFPPSHEHVKGFPLKCRGLKFNSVTGPFKTLFAGRYVCTFQPRRVTGWGDEGVKDVSADGELYNNVGDMTVSPKPSVHSE